MGTLGPENTLEDVKVKIKKAYNTGNVGLIKQVVLKEGPRAFRIATLLEILNDKTKKIHHFSLKIDQIDKSKKGWSYQFEKSVRLDGNNPDEIKRLYNFLDAEFKNKFGENLGELHLINSNDFDKLSNVLDATKKIKNKDKFSLLGSLVSHIETNKTNISEFVKAFEQTNKETLTHISNAAKIVNYSEAVMELRQLITNPDTPESKFQTHLENHPWMFGSEYSQRLRRKTWTKDERLDFMMRKTVDDYVEIIEIKKAFSEKLFVYDSSHESYYPSSKLSAVIGQVVKYIERIERQRDSIIATEGFDTLKIKAKIIVGRDNGQDQVEALRNLNSHLHRIEIITYDQLLKVSKRILNMFEIQTDITKSRDKGDIPF
ncbi:Shedu anti-phage system protein SduA domain-containing protein [Desulfoluna butyratoxydans]|uniref:Shedu protein SduA C-terminal domain-containing protein n=1 Tax=Desulfoluna butyratoxydans TaxID=231438 RepID=A0A4U8YRA0_9BACT|nr:Shedu anti-phage system protein SduA domain-containing protein [Desulfoluna butyratoxydans]VFQ46875.1 protein of unknown function duf4263 [Desulfoluna butyratoxydans]